MAAEPEFYTASEKARLVALVSRGAVRVQRGMSTAEIDAKIDTLKKSAVSREAAERRAVATAQQRRVDDRAAKRAARRWI
jgi:hypothetical protein